MTIGQTQLERAIHQIQNRVAVPELDFTQHQLENGYTVSTQERAVKEVCAPLAFSIALCGCDRCRYGRYKHRR